METKTETKDENGEIREIKKHIREHKYNMSKEQERAELHRTIWQIANDLRGSVDGWDFKNYVLGFLFYRFISEDLTAHLNREEAEAGNIVCRGCKTGIKASGIEGMNSVHDIDIQDCSIVYRQNDMIVDETTANLSTQNVVFTKDKK